MPKHLTTCPSCASENLSLFVEMCDMPVHIGTLWSDPAAARGCRRGDIRLASCGQCGLVTNLAFDDTRLDYDETYDNSLDHSPVFAEYAQELATRLVETHDLHNKTIVEIGCGRGDFLKLLCRLGSNRGLGFDTSYRDGSSERDSNVQFIAEHYGPQHKVHAADMVVCRQVLEHVDKPAQFLGCLRDNLRRGDTVFFDVPNIDMILQRLSIWDIIYEHCCYYSRPSLRRAFELAGFEVLNVRHEFDGQFLGIEAKAADKPTVNSTAPSSEIQRIQEQCLDFAAQFNKRKTEWRERIRRLRKAGRTTVVWGAGARAVTFMNLFDVADEIEFLVDINPRKQGTFLPGTGQRTLAPNQLVELRPDTVIVMNSIYAAEITQQLQNLGLESKILLAQEDMSDE